MSGTVARGRLVAGAALLSVLLVAALALTTNSLDTTQVFLGFPLLHTDGTESVRSAARQPFRLPLCNAAPGLCTLKGIQPCPSRPDFAPWPTAQEFCSSWACFCSPTGSPGRPRVPVVALLVTAFSLFNVKFLLFDVYRPDHLAYALILLQTYFALERRFWPLLLSTMLACQVREFNVVPLLAYLFALSRTQPEASAVPKRPAVLSEALISAVGLVAALGLPRLLIPVAEDYQFASLTRDGLLRILLAPFVLSRDANFVYSVIAYLLPSLMIAGVTEAASALGSVSPSAGVTFWSTALWYWFLASWVARISTNSPRTYSCHRPYSWHSWQRNLRCGPLG